MELIAFYCMFYYLFCTVCGALWNDLPLLLLYHRSWSFSFCGKCGFAFICFWISYLNLTKQTQKVSLRHFLECCNAESISLFSICWILLKLLHLIRFTTRSNASYWLACLKSFSLYTVGIVLTVHCLSDNSMFINTYLHQRNASIAQKCQKPHSYSTFIAFDSLATMNIHYLQCLSTKKRKNNKIPNYLHEIELDYVHSTNMFLPRFRCNEKKTSFYL